MKPKLVIFCSQLGVLAMALSGMPSFAQPPVIQPGQLTTTERFDLAPGGTLRVIHSYGDLRIEGWDLPEMEVTVTKSLPRFGASGTRDQDQHRLDSIHFATDHSSLAEVNITTTLASRHGDWAPFLPHTTTAGISAEYQIYVPRNTKLLIQHGVGSVFVSGVIGDIEASAKRGDIMLMLPDARTYSIDAKTQFGNVSSDWDGSVLSRFLVGQRFARTTPPPSQRLHLRMGFGGINIKAVPPEAVPSVVPVAAK